MTWNPANCASYTQQLSMIWPFFHSNPIITYWLPPFPFPNFKRLWLHSRLPVDCSTDITFSGDGRDIFGNRLAGFHAKLHKHLKNIVKLDYRMRSPRNTNPALIIRAIALAKFTFKFIICEYDLPSYYKTEHNWQLLDRTNMLAR